MSHNIEDLRTRLFAALDDLADKEKPMAIERARAIADVARVIVDSAKAEIQLLHTLGARKGSTEFIPVPISEQRRLPAPAAGGCSFCGGRLEPQTNGNGALVDQCRSCGRSPAAAGPSLPTKTSAPDKVSHQQVAKKR